MPAPVVNMFDVADYDGQILHAAKLLREGKVVVVPTETVYGAAALLKQPAAVKQLKSLRPGAEDKPLTVHLADRRDAAKLLGAVGDIGQRMMKKLWPGPMWRPFAVLAKPSPRCATAVPFFAATAAQVPVKLGGA